MFPSLQEFLLFILIIIILNLTGILPVVIRTIRELRGDYDGASNTYKDIPGSKADLEICYRLLGVSPNSSWNEIEQAYRKKAKKHHPDVGGDEDAMKALNEAYQILKRLYHKK